MLPAYDGDRTRQRPVRAISPDVGSMITLGLFVLAGVAVDKVGAMGVVSFLFAAFVAGETALSDADSASPPRAAATPTSRTS